MYSFNINALEAALWEIMQGTIEENSRDWLKEKAAAVRGSGGKKALYMGFSAVAGRVGKTQVAANKKMADELAAIRKGFTIENWPAQRVARVWLLLQVPAADRPAYVEMIKALFASAEMNELVALYSTLPVLAWPGEWALQCAEGIRSNIGDVLEAIMYENSYPAEWLEELAWNQLVLKAIFTEKSLNRITGLDERANGKLAVTLADFAHERWAAHRKVTPLMWRCVGPFINETMWPDVLRMARSTDLAERQAAAMACQVSSYGPAKELWETNAELKAAVEQGSVTWATIEEKARTAV